MRRQYEFGDRNFPVTTTSRVKKKPNLPVDFTRRSAVQNRSTTPTKLNQRINNSPLRIPLEKAISKVTKDKQRSFDRSSQSRSRYLGKSSRKQDSSIISMAKKLYYDEQPEKQMIKAHSETMEFINRYFGSGVKEIPIDLFIHKVMEANEALWGTDNVDKIVDDFTYKIADIFGCETVNVKELMRITRQDGMIGLILRIFKEIKNEENTRNSNYKSFIQNPQVMSINKSFEDRLSENQNINGIKNVVQQFMETMYQCMQSEIYNKFNIEMRRMVVKYRQTEKLLKKINQKLTTYADVFDLERKMKEKQRQNQNFLTELKRQNERLNYELNKEKDNLWNEKKEREKLISEHHKLKETLDKYQNLILNKAMENTYLDPSLSRHASNQQSRVLDKTNQNIKTSQIAQPFKITIDTHYIHKENGPPETKTYTTLHNPPTVSPSRRNSRDHLPPVPPSIFSTNVDSANSHRPYSPYQSRATRQ